MISAHCKRRIVRMIARAAGVTLFIVNGYVGSWMVFAHAAHHRYVSPALTNAAAPMFKPVIGYCRADYPGAGILGAMWWRVNPPIQRNIPLIGIVNIPAPFAPPRPHDRNGSSKVVMLDFVEPGGCR